MCRKVLTNNEYKGKICQHSDWRKIADRIVGKLFEKARIDCHARGDSSKQRIAVWRRSSYRRGANHRARAWAILYDNRYVKLFGQLVANKAGDDVGAATWRLRNDNGDRASWVTRGVSKCCGERDK